MGRGTRAPVDARWYKADKADSAKTLWETAKYIADQTRWIFEKDKCHAELYEKPGALSENASGRAYQSANIGSNVVRQGVDTLTAIVGVERPLPQVYTNRGDWGLQKRARRASEAIEGEFCRLKCFEELAEQWITDALTSRAGILEVCEEWNRVSVERVLPWELLVDPRDAKYGKPRAILRHRTVDKLVLAEKFPGRKGDIFAASDTDDLFQLDRRALYETSVDRVPVVTGYRLPSRPGGKDGRMVIGIPGAKALYDGPWTFDWFPFEILIFKPRKLGVWGVPLAELLEGYQSELEEVETSISEQMYLTAGGVILASTTCGLTDEAFNNGLARVMRHRPGDTPQWINPDPVHPAKLQYREELRSNALADSGVSQTSARGQKPPGITAGVALQHMADEQTQRFAPFERRVQAGWVGIGEKMLAFMRQIANREGDYTVRYHDKRGSTDLSWAKDFELPEESYHVKVEAVSFLSKRPEARFEQLEALVQAGRITDEQYFRLAQMPDLEEDVDVRLAGRDLVMDQVQDMLDAEDLDTEEGVAAAQQFPYPYGDLEFAKRHAQLSWCLAQRGKCPTENLLLLENYIEAVKAEIEKQKPPPAPPMQPQMMGPPPMGGPPVDPAMPPMGPPPMGPPPGEEMPPEALAAE